MTRVKKIALATVIFFSTIGFCTAEPASTVKYLMNKPVSLFDYGILRMQEDLKFRAASAYKIKHQAPSYLSVLYDAKSNKIVMYLLYTIYKKNVDEIENRMKDIVETMRAIFGPYYIETFFNHQGYVLHGEPKKKIGRNLERIIEIRLYANSAPLSKPYLKCVAAMSGEDVYCTNFPIEP
jgi:hypothetical protein